MPSLKTLVSKANLQYYHGKLQRLLDKVGTLNELEVDGEKAALDDGKAAILPNAAFYKDNSYNYPTPNLTYQHTNIRIDAYGVATVTDGHNTINFATHTDTSGKNLYTFYDEYYDGSDWTTHDKVRTLYDKTTIDDIFNSINNLPLRIFNADVVSEFGYTWSYYDTVEKFTNKSVYDTQDSELITPRLMGGVIWLYKVGNEYYEYVFVEGPNGFNNNDFTIEHLGTFGQDLTGYLQDTDISDIDNDYIDYLVNYADLEHGFYNNNLNRFSKLLTSSNQVITGLNPDNAPAGCTLFIMASIYNGFSQNFANRIKNDVERIVVKNPNLVTFEGLEGNTTLRVVYSAVEPDLTGAVNAKWIKI